MSKEWIIVEGRQWSVASFGLLKPDEDYDIQCWQLGEVSRDGLTPQWLEHVASKASTDLDDFLDMFTRAVRIHRGKFAPLPEGWHKAATTHIAKVKASRARHEAIKAEVERTADSDLCASQKGYLSAAYEAAAIRLYGPDWMFG